MRRLAKFLPTILYKKVGIEAKICAGSGKQLSQKSADMPFLLKVPTRPRTNLCVKRLFFYVGQWPKILRGDTSVKMCAYPSFFQKDNQDIRIVTSALTKT